MKKLICLIIILINIFCIQVKSQNNVQVFFTDTGINNKHIVIDTVNYPSNQWQIGPTVKNLFNEPLPNKVIVTDTVNSFASNDTSVFIFKVARPYTFGITSISSYLWFKYKLQKDSTDLFMVEVAADTGMHWVNMMTQDTTYQIVWYGNKPNFEDTANLGSWKIFQANFSWWFGQYYNQANIPYYADADTFKFRFTFISDSIQTNKDGCMIDDIKFSFLIPESIEEEQADANIISFYPIPLNNQLHIKRKSIPPEEEFLTIYALDGTIVYKNEISRKTTIPLSLMPGFYVLSYNTKFTSKQEKIIVE